MTVAELRHWLDELNDDDRLLIAIDTAAVYYDIKGLYGGADKDFRPVIFVECEALPEK